MDSSERIPLSSQIEKATAFQRYERGPVIDGVTIRRVKKNRSENGWFVELFRLSDGRDERSEDDRPFVVRQVSASYAEAGRLNAFHIHPLKPQNEVWTVSVGLLKIWLVDCRAGSPTEGIRQSVILGGEEPAQLYIPAGVAHGYRAGSEGALLLYAMDQQFDADDPNEGRLPWDHFGADLWAEDFG